MSVYTGYCGEFRTKDWWLITDDSGKIIDVRPVGPGAIGLNPGEKAVKITTETPVYLSK